MSSSCQVNDNHQQMLQSNRNNKPYADFLIDEPYNEQKEEDFEFILRNCLRYRLRIPTRLISGTQVNNTSTNSRIKSVYDTLMQVIDQFDATGIVEIYRLLLERRSAVPLFLPQSKLHFLELLRHVTLPRINKISLGGDKSLMRVAVISCRQRNKSQTCDFLKNIFNINSIYSLDLANRNISSEIMLAEIGCGCIVTEESGTQIIQNVLVVHVMGDFRPLWPFLRLFADCFLIEDSTKESESFFSSFMTEDKRKEIELEDVKIGGKTKTPMGCIWKPSIEDSISETKETNGFPHLYIEDQLTDESRNKLKFGIVDYMKKTSTQPNFAKNRLTLYEIPILKDKRYNSFNCVSPTEHQSTIRELVRNLENIKKNKFLLQKNFLEEAKHEEAKMEHRLNETRVKHEDEEIKKIRAARREKTCQVETNSLLKLFLSFLDDKDPCSRVLTIRMLEKELTERGEQELDQLLINVKKLTNLLNEKLTQQVDEKELQPAKENLLKAKVNLIESVLNMEHLWRELSHLYTDTEPGKRSPIIKKIPRLAAQHLMDGFCLELVDGDSNMIRLDWMNEVLFQLDQLIKGKRIFVLSVMGIQSSGKSTLLNTMFGIKMRTSVGQCTRGVNMQLLAVQGRPEYDYILLLDTEGTRSPEFHGVDGSEKRDNQMATLSILMSDASIVVIPGENDAAVKEILPIVLMAYQGSQLAEEKGGRLSSRMFFVYNRIDTQQKKNLDSIIQTLGNSLHDAFTIVQNSNGNKSTYLKSENPFSDFKMDSSDSSASDVRILGNVNKQTEPPDDVPDEKYGAELIQLREHIHRRVANVEGKTKWKSRSVGEFSSYIKNVWECICSANFILTFKTIMEHETFDKLDFDYKKIERKLAEAYEKSFANIRKEMITLSANKKSSVSLDDFEEKLRNELHQIQMELNEGVDDLVKEKGREKWKVQFENMWESNKRQQDFNWKCNLKNTFDTIFNYEKRVEEYKKKMRQEINEFFKTKNPDVSKWTKGEKNEIFDEMFDKLLSEAKDEFPRKEVAAEIIKVYQNSTVIKNRTIPINLNSHGILNRLKAVAGEYLKKQYTSLFGNEKENKKKNSINLCADSVDNTIKRITNGKFCYSDSIISEMIRSVDEEIKTYNITERSKIEELNDYGMRLIINLMEDIEKEWERENSVPVKLESNKEILRKHFMMVSEGVAKTKLFASNMAATLEKNIKPAFEKEMVLKIFKGIRNERWLYDARFMQKHMDLFLIDLLEDKQLDKVLDHIRNPKEFYAEVLHRLIAKKIVNVDDEWQSFINHLTQSITHAAAVKVERRRAQTFVDQLRKEFLEGYLQSETLGFAFSIDCSDEYEDCDNEDTKQFQNACVTELNQVLNKQMGKQASIQDEKKYAKELSPKVVRYMIITSNDKAALPRCDECCCLCKSLCMEAANHDTKEKPHDAIHQPGGVAGTRYHGSDKLSSKTCSQSYEQDRGFFLSGDETVPYKYRDFATVFPGWKDPRINEELPLREYILATYNEEIAKKYKVKPADDIPASYFRHLSSIKQQLKREIENC
uniref:VLIG-type G domain-containing protein n=1 Tax=Daphnia galeata TaxID=27404 RepID=A0A8J2WVP4_9CRUS|nr:unnamed protein product [Daphnia galeata]